MVHCKHCKSTFPQHVVTHHSGFPECPICHDDVGLDAMDKVTGGPDLLPDGSNYDKYAYLNPGFTVDIAIFRWRRETRKIQVLLIKRKFHPYAGAWALPGGFYDERTDKSIADIAERELAEETGLKGLPLAQGVPFGSIDRDPRQFTVTAPFCAIVPADAELPAKAGDDAEDWGWFDCDGGTPLAFDHATIIAHLLNCTLAEKVGFGDKLFLTSFLDDGSGRCVGTLPEIRALLHQIGIIKPFRTTQHIESWLKARGYKLIPEDGKAGNKGRPAQLFQIS